MTIDLSQLDGLAQVRALLEAGTQPPFGRKTGISLVSVDYGHSVFEADPDESDFNPMGTVHGGFIAAMLDSACGIAAHSALKPSCSYVTLELKTSFVRALTGPTGTVQAVGRLLSIGSRAAFTEAWLYDSQRRLCATATSTLLIFSRSPSTVSEQPLFPSGAPPVQKD